MSLNVVATHLGAGPGVLSEGGGGSFEPPTTADFYQPLIGDGAWALTRAGVLAILSVLILGWFFLAVSGKLAIVPGKRQWMAEQVYGFVRNTIGRDVIGHKDFLPFVPFLFALFSFILINNLFGIMPFIQFPTMSRFAFPVMLTAIVYVVYHTVAVRRKGGVLPYLKSIVPAGLPGWMVPVMFVLEFFTYFITRPVTLALRLFGNMFAGHLLLLVFTLGGEYLLFESGNIGLNLAGVLSFGMVIVMTFFELLVQFLQAFIFTMLTALYIAGAVSEEH